MFSKKIGKTKRMRRGTMYNQSDIILIPFPYSDLSASEQRPALIISNHLINRTEDRICCLVTKNFRKEDLLIKKEDFKSGSLPFKSLVRPHRIFTIHHAIIKKKLCSVNNGFHNKVISKLNEYISRV